MAKVLTVTVAFATEHVILKSSSWTTGVETSSFWVTAHQHAEEVVGIFAYVGTQLPFHALHGASSTSIRWDFWDQLSKFPQKAREFAEYRLSKFKSNPVILAKIEEIQALYAELIVAGKEFQERVVAAAQAQGVDPDEVLKELEKLMGSVFETLKSEFPPPDHAPQHEERQANVHRALVKIEAALVDFLQRLGWSEEEIRVELDKLIPPIERVVVMIGEPACVWYEVRQLTIFIAGDLAQQHPILCEVILETLLFAATLPLVEVVVLKQILLVIGFGPYGPIKGESRYRIIL